MNKYQDVVITFAGEGPEKDKIIHEMEPYSDRVTITQYQPDTSLMFHKDYDISVVCTVGSEGTSLSLLEAMAAGCCVICTNVGGMTNIILDDFNGKMISPDADELFNTLCELHDDENLRKKLGQNANITVTESFSIDKWKKSWKQILLH